MVGSTSVDIVPAHVNCHRAIPFDPSLVVMTVLVVLAVLAILAVLALLAVLVF